jgi:hypothetical protein
LPNAADDAAACTVIEVRVTLPALPDAPVCPPSGSPIVPAAAGGVAAANDNDPGGSEPSRPAG